MIYTKIEHTALGLIVELEEAIKKGYAFPARVITAMNTFRIAVEQTGNIDHKNIEHLYKVVYNREVKPLSVVRKLSLVTDTQGDK